MKRRFYRLGEVSSEKVETYTTPWRKQYQLYSPGTYEHYSFTRGAYGKSINVSYEELVKLSKENPDAYIHFLVNDSHSVAWVKVKNIRVYNVDE